MQRFDAVLFDLDDTLHDDTRAFTTAAEEVAREVAAEHGIDALVLKAAYVAEAEGFWKKLSAEQVKAKLGPQRERLWGSALKRVGLTEPALARTTADAYHAYRKKYWVPHAGALDLLHALRERGVKLGMLTNGFAETHREKLDVLRLTDAFDAVFFPDEVGMLKPDPLLFAHACAELDCAPSRSAMVGDRYGRDIRGALDAGLFAIWVNARAEAPPPGAKPASVTVCDLAGVRSVLLSGAA